MTPDTKAPPTNGVADKAAAEAAIAQVAQAPAPVDLATAVADVNKARVQTKEEVVESDEFVDALYLGLTSGTHVYVAGSGGVGKTFGTEVMARHFGTDPFYIQFRNDTKREEVFGPLSMTALQQDRYEHVTTGYLPEALIATLDEFKDAGRFTRQLLNILNERWFVNGGVRINVPLISAVGATNFWIEEEELAALFDRFAQRMEQTGVSTSRGFKKILKGQLGRGNDLAGGKDRTKKLTVVTMEQLAAVRLAVLACRVDDHIIDLVDELRKTAKKDENLEMSPRRWGEGIKLAQANAVLNGRDHVNEEDLRPYARVLPAHPDDFKIARDLTKAFRDKLGAAVEESRSALTDVRALLAPQREKLAAGEQIDFAELTAASNLMKTLVAKVEEAKASNGGRTSPDLEKVLEDVKDEEKFMQRAVLGR
jgi:MoxR-like ATPase